MSSSSIPTAAYPLTPSFHTPQDPEPTPSDHHPATPRFLLSLLATSIYLSIPSVATQALSLILSTVGPTTALLYLNFALGKPLSHPSPSSGQPEAAVGLETVALPLEEEEDDISNPSSPSTETCRSSEAEEFADILSELAVKDNTYPLSPSASSGESISSTETSQDDDIVCHYGAVSNKIGEASSCWLARWAVDMFNYETGRIPALSRRSPLGGGSVGDNSQSSSSDHFDATIWGRGGLSAKWVAALVSSDCLFVKNERHRYDFARSVVELRRAGGVLSEEEQEWSKMFETGIYYSNMVSLLLIQSKFLSLSLTHHFSQWRI